MRTITKESEPACLRRTRRHAERLNDFDWSNLVSGCSGDIRANLLAEQHHVCVYCGGRINEDAPTDSNPSGTTIEHWLAREHHPGQMFDGNNLFGVCRGESVFEGARHQHCDTARGSQLLHVHPTTRHIEGRLHVVKSSGRLRPADDEDAELREDIEALCLNTPRLMANRREVIARLQAALGRNDSKAAILSLWRAAQPDGQGRLEAYAFVAQLYLRKKAGQRGISLP